MKNSLMSIADKILLRKRALIETVNDELKNIAQIEHSRHRSFAAYCLFEKKPAMTYVFSMTGNLLSFDFISNSRYLRPNIIFSNLCLIISISNHTSPLPHRQPH